MVLDALRHKDRRLRVYAVEALRRTRPDVLTAVADAKLVDWLVKKGAKSKNSKLRASVFEVLTHVAPDVDAKKPSDWTRWWGKTRKAYAPTEWPKIERSKNSEEGKTSTAPFVAKAFDLQAAGLDVVVAIDSTGSMQQTIDSARDALDNIVAILAGIAPKFRVGLVHYRDLGELTDGAQMLEPLTKDVEKVEKKLGRLVAGGGGDFPERVEKGLALAFHRDMKWKRTANKVVVLIGDAPPHPEAIETAVELARRAHKDPGRVGRSGPSTGSKKKAIPPYITSAISIGGGASEAFRQIADAGGGAFAQMRGARGQGRGGGGGRGRRGRPDGGGPRGGRAGGGGERGPRNSGSSSRAIAGHILSMSFGPRWRKRMDEFVEIYFEYRDAGAF